MSSDRILQDQIDYYRARAGEYDEWWFRQGRYDRGDEFNARWHAETARVERALDDVARASQAPHACSSSPAARDSSRGVSRRHVGARNRGRCITGGHCDQPRARSGGQRRTTSRRILFEWRPPPGERYDVVFFSFWLSHVPDRASLPSGPASAVRSLRTALPT